MTDRPTPTNARATLRRLLGWLGPERWRLALMATLILVNMAINLSFPLFLGHATDLIFQGFISSQLESGVSKDDVVAGLEASGDQARADLIRSLPIVPGAGLDVLALSATLVIALTTRLVGAAIQTGWMRLAWVVMFRILSRMRSLLEAKVHRLPLRHLDGVPRGDVISRVMGDTQTVATSVFPVFGQLFGVFSLVTMLIVMLVLSPIMTLVVVGIIPVTALVVTLLGRRTRKLYVAQAAQLGAVTSQVESAYTGHTIISTFGRWSQVRDLFTRQNGDLFRRASAAQMLGGTFSPAISVLGNVGFVAVAVVGGLFVAGGSISLGTVQVFVFYAQAFMEPLTMLGNTIPTVQSAMASAERLFVLLDAEEERDESDEADWAPSPTGPGRVAFEEISFRYDPEKPLIDGLSFVAEPGHTIAIVGPTGAGKTTLVNLLMRFYDLDGGRITLDGVDISALTRHDLRSRVGMVLQDSWLFDGTIRENIAYGRPDATEDDIVAAAREAYVDRFVHVLPDGYDTRIGGESDSLSAGEKQLITIARAFLARPTLLILDEATSSVDTRTELLVQRAMYDLRRSRTSFVIAHRLSTIRDANTILVMESGAIVEKGTHSELLTARGAYARLYDAQFAAPMDEDDAA